MFIPIVSFLVNLVAALLLFLVTVGDLAIARFFTSFYFMKVNPSFVTTLIHDGTT